MLTACASIEMDVHANTCNYQSLSYSFVNVHIKGCTHLLSDWLFVAEFAKRGLIHASNFPTLMSHNFICKQATWLKFSVLLVQCDRTVMLPNFNAVGPIEAELHILKVEKLDVCIRPLSVTFNIMACT